MLWSEAAAATDTTGIVEAIRRLGVARNIAVKARFAGLCQLGNLLVTAPAALREQLNGRQTLEGKASVLAPLRPDTDRLADPAQIAHTALRSLGRHIARLDGLVAAAAANRGAVSDPALTTLRVCPSPREPTSTDLAPRVSSAHQCATAPVPISSERTSGYRLMFAVRRAATEPYILSSSSSSAAANEPTVAWTAASQ